MQHACSMCACLSPGFFYLNSQASDFFFFEERNSVTFQVQSRTLHRCTEPVCLPLALAFSTTPTQLSVTLTPQPHLPLCEVQPSSAFDSIVNPASISFISVVPLCLFPLFLKGSGEGREGVGHRRTLQTGKIHHIWGLLCASIAEVLLSSPSFPFLLPSLHYRSVTCPHRGRVTVP